MYTDPNTSAASKAIVGCGSVPLSTPNNLNALYGNGQCTLSWNESSGARPISYSVMRASVAGTAATSTQVACPVTSTTTCTATGLMNGSTYYFAVKALNADEESGWSTEASCKPLIPANPPLILAAPAHQQCTISWPPAVGTSPMSYNVYRSDSPPVTKTSMTICSGIAPTTCLSTGLVNGTTYYYAASSSNEAGDSPLSNQVTCTPCPAGFHFVGTSCIQTFSVTSQSRTAISGTVNHNIGSHHYCVLTNFTYDGAGTGTCTLTGVQDGLWRLTVSDDGPQLQRCTAQCSDIELLGTDPLPGSICLDSGKTGIRIGSCCATGLSSSGFASDISCN